MSARKAARSIFAAKSKASWQAFRISRRVASSRDKERLRAPEDRLPADPIAAPLDRATIHEVDLPPDELRQLGLHRHVVENAPVCFGRERHQKIYVAVRPKVGTQCRAEDRELGDLPTAAERRETALVDGKLWIDSDRRHASPRVSILADCCRRVRTARARKRGLRPRWPQWVRTSESEKVGAEQTSAPGLD